MIVVVSLVVSLLTLLSMMKIWLERLLGRRHRGTPGRRSIVSARSADRC